MPTPVPEPPACMTDGPGRSLPNPDGGPPRSPNKRPKLSLQTTALQTSHAGLSKPSPFTGAAKALATPTTANTYSNTWDLSFRPSPISRTDSPRLIPIPRTQAPEQPYNLSLPFGVRSILKNTPLPNTRRGSVSASPREAKRKVFFPQQKKVMFKAQLEDVIETSQYVAKHSDLSSSDEESSSSGSKSSSDEERLPRRRFSSPPARKRKNRRDSGVSVTPVKDPNETDTSRSKRITSTPRGDRKRRKWEWTLPSIESTDPSPDTEISLQERDDNEQQQPEKETSPNQGSATQVDDISDVAIISARAAS